LVRAEPDADVHVLGTRRRTDLAAVSGEELDFEDLAVASGASVGRTFTRRAGGQ
jgi:hypothetical protein